MNTFRARWERLARFEFKPARTASLTLAVALALATLGNACTKKETASSPDAAATAAATAAAAGGANEPGAEKIVHLAIWSNYVSDAALAEFKAATGITVKVSNFSSNEELLAKLQAGGAGYDVIVPSDYMVFAMVQLGLLQPLDAAKLPNIAKLDPKVLKMSFDPENKYSFPYDWGTTGIAVNREKFKGNITGWKDLFAAKELAGKFTMLDDVREALGAVLKSQGKSLNTKDPKELAAAKAELLKLKGKVKAFSSETKGPLVSGEIWAAHAYSSDALQARQESGGKIEYVIPAEGATLWIDNLAIPKGAANVESAHALINYMLDAKVGATAASTLFLGPVNRDVVALLPKELQADTALFPSAAVMGKLERLEDLGESLSALDRIWTEIKAGSAE